MDGVDAKTSFGHDCPSAVNDSSPINPVCMFRDWQPIMLIVATTAVTMPVDDLGQIPELNRLAGKLAGMTRRLIISIIGRSSSQAVNIEIATAALCLAVNQEAGHAKGLIDHIFIKSPPGQCCCDPPADRSRTATGVARGLLTGELHGIVARIRGRK